MPVITFSLYGKQSVVGEIILRKFTLLILVILVALPTYVLGSVYITLILFKYLCHINVKFQVLKGFLLSEKSVRNSYLVGEHCIRDQVISLYICYQ